MEKEKRVMVITIGLVCFVLFYTIFVQFRVVEETDISGIAKMQETELKESLSDWKTKYNEANEKLEQTNNKIAEYQSIAKDKDKSEKLLEEELKNANMMLGKTDVEGEGIEVTINDGYKTELDGQTVKSNVIALDLIQIVNELRKAGAEAISINDERITNMTDIVDIGNKYTLVNSQVVSGPYTVKAIGERNYLQSALGIKNGYIDQMSANGKSVSVETKRNIKIFKYEAKTDKDKLDIQYINIE